MSIPGSGDASVELQLALAGAATSVGVLPEMELRELVKHKAAAKPIMCAQRIDQ